MTDPQDRPGERGSAVPGEVEWGGGLRPPAQDRGPHDAGDDQHSGGTYAGSSQ